MAQRTRGASEEQQQSVSPSTGSQLVIRNTFLEIVDVDAQPALRKCRTESWLHMRKLGFFSSSASESEAEAETASDGGDEVPASGSSQASSTPISVAVVSPLVEDVRTRQGGAMGSSGSSRQPEPLPESRMDKRTTVILKNLPNNYTRDMFLAMIDREGFNGQYDFVYLPTDFKTHASFGYGFVNLISHAVAETFWQAFNGYNKWEFPSTKVCQVGWSKPYQGLRANVQRFRNSPVMHKSVPQQYRPCIFKQGAMAKFPRPTRVVQPPPRD
mmetsp:Transcript_12562/g.32276  ORF Transcript_12562/g.32276 Transcript_12562/m.32276 type:complete len:271 (+) Transcript_12562:81-893(+)